jgi:leucyl aminopeptidase (aminopeptidase T)
MEAIMLEYVPNFQVAARTAWEIQPNEQVLIIADDTARPTLYGQVFREVIKSLGAEVSLMIIPERSLAGEEPPRSAAAAMLGADVVVRIPEKWNMVHTNARRAATDRGIRFYHVSCGPEALMRQPVTDDDIGQIARRTELIGRWLTEAEAARVTSTAGTDIRMSLKGRTATYLHPRGRPLGSSPIPGTGEATLPPVEETAEGVVVIDISIAGREGLLPSPVRWIVQKGRIVRFEGPQAIVEWLNHLASRDAGASVLCQLAIGTSHTITALPTGTNIDHGREGRIHMAFGRNDDFGGQTFSIVHVDGLFGGTTVELDGKTVIENERVLT